MDVEGADDSPAPPPPPSLTPEEEIALLFDMLDRLEPNCVFICEALKTVGAMHHNKPLLRNSFGWLRNRVHHAQNSGDEAMRVAAFKAQKVVEAVYNAIVNPELEAEFANQSLDPPPGAIECLKEALEHAGVGARVDPFPAFNSTRCDTFQTQVLDPSTGAVAQSPDGTYLFEVMQPHTPQQNTTSGSATEQPGGGGGSGGTGRSYAFIQTIRKAIYGRVRLAQVLEVVPTDDPAAAAAAAAQAGGGGGGGFFGGLRSTFGGPATPAAAGGGAPMFRMTNRRVAVKCISKERVEQMKRARSGMNENPLKEIAGMQYITDRMSGRVAAPDLRGDPSRVLPILECLEDDNWIYTIMPCLEDEMFNVVEAHGRFSEAETFLYLEQILDGLEVLHSLGLAHHDMSLENLMLDAQGKCVIIDLGMVVKVPLRANGLPIKISPSRDWPGRCGKMLYLAPEILNPVVSFDPLALDMWAVGVMMFVLLTGVPPWDVETGPSPADQRFALVQNGRLIDLLTAWNFTDLSASCVDLMQSFLRADPNTRFTIAQARNHVWYTTMHAQVPVATQAAAPGTF